MMPKALASALLVLLGGCAPLGGLDPARRAAPPVLTVTPGEELLRLTIPGAGARPDTTAMLKRVGVNGTVETWMSQDRRSLALDGGIVVASRGFGFDLMGQDAAPIRAALSEPGQPPHARHMRYLTADNHSTWLRASCEIRPRGKDPETGLFLLEENCDLGNGGFTNLYWLEGAGRILRSAQFIAPELGYFRLETARQPQKAPPREMSAPR